MAPSPRAIASLPPKDFIPEKDETLQMWPTKLSWAGYKDGHSMQYV